jgi:hypothetical protein
MAYTLPVDLVPALSTALYLATSAVLLVVVNVYYARAGLWPMLYASAAGQPEPVTGREKVGGPSFLPDGKTSVRPLSPDAARVFPCSLPRSSS